MRSPALLLTALVLLAAGAFSATATPVISAGECTLAAKHLPHDPCDLARYKFLGQWVTNGQTPFRDYEAEYPPLAVAFFGAVRAVTTTDRGYVAVFTAAVALAAVGLALVTASTLLRLGRSPWWLLVLLLPSSLYYLMNRFDVLAVLPLVAAIGALLGKRYRTAGVLLGIAVGVKFFPILLAPLFLITERADRPGVPWRALRFPLAFIGTAAATYLIPALFWGPGVLGAVVMQIARLPARGSLLTALLLHFTSNATTPLAVLLRALFTGLTVVPLVGSALARIPTAEPSRARAVVGWSGLILVTTVLLNPFFSPQFLIWYVPLLLLLTIRPTPAWAALLVLLDLSTFVQFPVVFDLAGPFGAMTTAAILVRSVISAVAIAVLARVALPTLRRTPVPTHA